MPSRGVDPFDKRSMALSVAVHATLFAIGWLSTFHRAEAIPFITYEIEMVSPPPAAQAEEVVRPTEELVVERPDPEPTPPEPPPREEPAEQPPEPDEEVRVAAAPEEVPEEVPAESGEGLNVRIEGLRRDYPQYYENIINQIRRCFRWQQGGTWETTVGFVITRDGTATDIDFVSRSGNTSFDFEAYAAVECAGRGRFGPLPEDLPWDTQPVRFQFRPRGEVLQIFEHERAR